MVNPNAHIFLHPPGIEADENDTNPRMQRTDHHVTDHGVYPLSDEPDNREQCLNHCY